MYAGVILYLPGTALLLGSGYAAVASVVLILGLAVRILTEERELRAGLAGYEEDAPRVRGRLILLVW